MSRKDALLPSFFRKGRESMKKKLSLCVAAALGAAVLFGGNAEAAYTTASSEENLDIQGNYDYGIQNNSGTETSYTGEEISVANTTTGKQSAAVYADSNASSSSVINLGGDATKNIFIAINEETKNANGLEMGLWARGDNNKKGGIINVKGDNLRIEGTSGFGYVYGVIAQNIDMTNAGKNEAADGEATVNINTENTYINVDSSADHCAYGLVAMSNGNINVDSNLEVHADGGAVLARGNAVVNVNTDGKHSTKLYGDINFNYDQKTSGTAVDAVVNVNLTGAESVWEGNTIVSWDGNQPGNNQLEVKNVNLTLADGAQWNAVSVEEYGESENFGARYTALNNLNLNGGIINITGAKEQTAEGATAVHTGLTIEKLSGTGGTVNLEAADDFTTRELSILSVGSAEEETQSSYGLSSLSAGFEKERETQSSPTKLAVNFTGINADDIAKSEGSLEKLAGNLKFGTSGSGISGDDLTVTANVNEGLIKGAISANIITTGTESGEDGSVPGHIVLKDVQQNSSTTMENMKNIAAVSIAAWRQEDSTLSQRLGDLRETAGGQGIWARVSRGEFEYSGEFKNQYNYFQIGWDMAKDDWHYGAAVSYNDGETTYSDGNGENSSTSLSLYGTRLLNDGQYFDIVLKAGRLNNKYDNYAAAGHTHGDYDAWGTEISGEYGKKIDLANDWFVTPQAQLSLMRIGSEDYTTSNGIHVDQDTLYSAVGRIGAEAGKKTAWGSLYAKASVLHDFAGDADTYLTYQGLSNSYSQDIGDTWYEAGFGANWKMSDSSYLYVDVIRTFGGDIETPWQWNAGVRWGF